MRQIPASMEDRGPRDIHPRTKHGHILESPLPIRDTEDGPDHP